MTLSLSRVMTAVILSLSCLRVPVRFAAYVSRSFDFLKLETTVVGLGYLLLLKFWLGLGEIYAISTFSLVVFNIVGYRKPTQGSTFMNRVFSLADALSWCLSCGSSANFSFRVSLNLTQQ